MDKHVRRSTASTDKPSRKKLSALALAFASLKEKPLVEKASLAFFAFNANFDVLTHRAKKAELLA